MKKWKKLCWMLFVICGIAVSFIPQLAQAAETAVTTYTSDQVGEGLQAQLDADGILTISGAGEMKNWSSTGSPWYNEREQIKKIVIEAGVTSVGAYAFQNCAALTEVSLPSELQIIGNYAFRNCTALGSIDLNKTTIIKSYAFDGCSALAAVDLKCVTELENNAFNRCNALESVEFPATLTSIGSGGVFTNCAMLTRVVFKSGTQTIQPYACAGMNNLTTVAFENNAEGICEITEIGNYAFRNCSALQEIALPSGVTTLGYYIFDGCRQLTKAALPSGLQALGEYMFYNCSALTEIAIPESLSEISRGAFMNCTALEYMDFSHIIRIREYAFSNCSLLKEPDLKNVQAIENYAFRNCDAFQSVTIPAALTEIGSSGVFADCDNLTRIVFAAGMETVPASICRNMYNLTTVEFEKDKDGKCAVTAIGREAFANCSGLLTIFLPDGLTAIGESAFSGCSRMRDFIIPDTVEQIGRRAFANCNALRIVSIGERLTAGAIDSSAFYRSNPSELMIQTNNTYLREEYDWSKSNITPMYAVNSFGTGENGQVLVFERGLLAVIGSGAMEDYTGSDTVPWREYLADIRDLFIGSNITRIGSHSFEESGLTNLFLKDCMSLKEIGDSAFARNERLDYIFIKDDLELIGEHAFYAKDPIHTILETESQAAAVYDWGADHRLLDTETVVYHLTDAVLSYIKDKTLILRGNGRACDFSGNNQPWKNDAFTEVDIQEGITGLGTYSFYRMTGITAVNFPGTLEEIGRYAFSGCTGLTQIPLQEGLFSIGDNAFAQCTSLTRFSLPQTLSTIGANAFLNCTALQQVTLPQNLTSLGNGAFKGCISAGTVSMECAALDIISDSAFEGCSALRTLAIPSSVKKIGKNAFSSCSRLNMVRFSEGIISLGAGAFADCESLTSVRIPRSLTTAEVYRNVGPFGASLQKVTFADKTRTVPANLFYGCTGLADIALPETLSEIESSAFWGCTSLSEIKLPDTMGYIGDRAFYECTALQDAALPETVESIGTEAFYGCAGIKEVRLPENLQALGDSAFGNCTALETVTFQSDLTMIPAYAFYSCSLTEVHLPYKVRSIGRNAFAGNADLALITIPAFTASIASDAFADILSLTIGGAAGSYAQTYASENGFVFDEEKGIAAEEITAKRSSLTLANSSSETLRVDVAPSTATDTIVWESSDEETISVKADENNPTEASVRARKEGTAVITVRAGAVSATITAASENLVTDLSLDNRYLYLTEPGETKQLNAYISPSDALNADLVWKTSDQTVATVDENGLVTAAGGGVARITAALKDGSMQAYCFVNVNPKIEMTGIELSDSRLFLTSGGAALCAKILPEGSKARELKWTSSDETVAMVDKNGYVTAGENGTATITVSNVPETESDAVYHAECIVTVQSVDVHVESVALDKNVIYLRSPGETARLTAEVLPENADLKEVSYHSSDADVAAVDKDGNLTAGKSGVAVITAKTLEGGHTAECRVVVSYQLTDISFDVNAMELKPGETRKLTATFEPAFITTPSVEWYTTNSHVATVDETGLVTAVALGSADIKCRSTDGTNITTMCRVSVAEKSGGQPETPSPNPPQIAPDQPETPQEPKPVSPVKPVIKKAVIKKAVPGQKKLKLTWKKQSGVTGYQIQYALKKNFSGKKTVWIKSSKTTSKTITKLKSKKKYYVRIRAYKTVKGTKYYGAWSNVVNKKTK